MNTNEETRLRNLLSKQKDRMPLTSLDKVFLKKLTAKKRNEATPSLPTTRASRK
jgi:hypothetical protein